MYLPGNDKLNIQNLSRAFSDMSESYKIFWFNGIINVIESGKTEASYDEIINNMIVSAWYMVSEYHLNLGPSDAIEKLILRAHEISNLKTSAKEDEIIDFINTCNDSIIVSLKKRLTDNVPYRFQAPFLPDVKGNVWNKTADVIERVNRDSSLIYHFGGESGLKRTIHIHDEWIEYLKINMSIISGWLEYSLINYLQKRNPSVPGISNKLKPPMERKLEKAKKFWKAVIDSSNIINIYSEDKQIMTVDDISLDHFIPWSYVAHDELWNLVPTTKSLNSSKSNDLPNWDRFFPLLCDIEYNSYIAVKNSDQIHDLFEKCKKEHVNSNEAMNRLYIPNIQKSEFASHLEELMLPTYKAAKNLGFSEWKR